MLSNLSQLAKLCPEDSPLKVLLPLKFEEIRPALIRIENGVRDLLLFLRITEKGDTNVNHPLLHREVTILLDDELTERIVTDEDGHLLTMIHLPSHKKVLLISVEGRQGNFRKNIRSLLIKDYDQSEQTESKRREETDKKKHERKREALRSTMGALYSSWIEMIAPKRVLRIRCEELERNCEAGEKLVEQFEEKVREAEPLVASFKSFYQRAVRLLEDQSAFYDKGEALLQQGIKIAIEKSRMRDVALIIIPLVATLVGIGTLAILPALMYVIGPIVIIFTIIMQVPKKENFSDCSPEIQREAVEKFLLGYREQREGHIHRFRLTRDRSRWRDSYRGYDSHERLYWGAPWETQRVATYRNAGAVKYWGVPWENQRMATVKAEFDSLYERFQRHIIEVSELEKQMNITKEDVQERVTGILSECSDDECYTVLPSVLTSRIPIDDAGIQEIKRKENQILPTIDQRIHELKARLEKMKKMLQEGRRIFRKPWTDKEKLERFEAAWNSHEELKIGSKEGDNDSGGKTIEMLWRRIFPSARNTNHYLFSQRTSSSQDKENFKRGFQKISTTKTELKDRYLEAGQEFSVLFDRRGKPVAEEGWDSFEDFLETYAEESKEWIRRNKEELKQVRNHMSLF